MRRIALLLALIVFPLTLGFAQDSIGASDWQWRFVSGGATVGAGAFTSRGRYYFPAEDRYLYAVDPNGVMIWRTDLGRRATGGIAVLPDGTIVIVLSRGRVVALNQDGLPVWQIDLGGDVVAAPAIFRNGLIVLVDDSGTVSCWTHHGTEVWQLSLESAPVADPVILSNGTIVVANADGGVELYRPDGATIRRRYLGETATVLAADERIILGAASGRVLALDPTGEPIWRADVGSAIASMRISAEGDVYTTSDDGSLARITPAGVVAWRLTPGSARMLPPVLSAGIVTASSDGVVSALDRSGGVQWQMRSPDLPTSLSVSPDGLLFVSTATWVTYAYRNSVPDSGGWPVARGTAGRWGGDAAGRASLSSYEGSAEYLTAWGLIRSGSQRDQVVTMAGIREDAYSGELAARYHWMLSVAEWVAGAPYLGPISQSGAPAVARRARTEAILTIGEIGDLQSIRLLATLIEYEPDPTVQAELLSALGRLGAAVDENLAARLEAVVRRNAARGPDSRLANAVIGFVRDVDQFRGGYLAPRVADVLLLIASSDYPRETRLYALEVLRGLGGGTAQ